MAIIIKDFHKGIAKSSYFGFEEMRGLNITGKPGVCYPNRALVKESASVVDDLIIGTCFDDSGELYGYSSEVGNHIFQRNNGTWTELSGFTNTGIAGIGFWKGYVIVAHTNGSLDATSDGGSNWSNGFANISSASSNNIQIVAAQDDKLYFGNGRYVDRLVEDTTFDPSNGATFTITQGALDLPENYFVTQMVENGDDLWIGTKKTGDNTVADIFPWDMVSPSFDLPIRLQEDGVTCLVSVNNLLYIQAGKKTKWYVSNGSSVEFLSQVPTTLLDLTTINLEIWHNARAYMNGLIYFGVSYNSIIGNLGIYSLNIKTGVINFEHIISEGETGDNDLVRIGSITALGGSNNNLLVTWQDDNPSTTYGADDIGGNGYTSNKSYLTSRFYRAGEKANKKGFSKLEIQLSKPLASGDSVVAWKRTAQNGSWTSVGTFNTVGQQSASMPFGGSYENVQIKVALNDEAELLELRII